MMPTKLSDQDIEILNRYMEVWKNKICPGREYDQCSPCQYHMSWGCTHPDSPHIATLQHKKDILALMDKGMSYKEADKALGGHKPE